MGMEGGGGKEWKVKRGGRGVCTFVHGHLYKPFDLLSVENLDSHFMSSEFMLC